MRGVQWVAPTFHPSFICRQNARYFGVVKRDLRRALELSRGARPNWSDAGYIYKPTVAQIESYLSGTTGKVSIDIETDGRHPMICDVRCIGFWNGRQGMCIPLLFRDGTFEEVRVPGKKKLQKRAVWKHFYSPSDEKLVLTLLAKFYNRVDVHVGGQNFKYDRICQRIRLGLPVPQRYWDTILIHHVIASCFPHGLDFLTSVYTEANYYKKTEEGEAWSTQSDEELWKYCIRDCKATFIVDSVEQTEIERPEDRFLIEFDHRMALECERWQEDGIRVDTEALALFSAYYIALRDRALSEMRKLVWVMLKDKRKGNEHLEALTALIGAADADEEGSLFKPGSLPQLRKLCQGIGIPLLHETDTGELSTAKEYLLEARTILIEQGVSPKDPRLHFLNLLFAWRDAQKIESTYLRPEILPDGRVHPNYNVHVVPTGRLSASDPGIHQQPKEIRGIYVAEDGHSLVSGDWDSGELRLAALLSGEPVLIKAFAEFDAGTGPKVHKVNCCNVFNIKMEEITDALYRAAKVVIYALLYGATKPTIYEQCRKEMPDLTFEAFGQCYDNLKRAMPVMFEWQETIVREAIRAHYMDSPFLKRRIHFLEPGWGTESKEASKMLNAPEQSGLADSVGTANFRILDTVFPKFRARLKRGEVFRQLTQVHDELLFEVPDRLVERFSKDFKHCAELPPPGHPTWKLPVEVHSSKRWAKIPFEVLDWANGSRPDLLTTNLTAEYEKALAAKVEAAKKKGPSKQAKRRRAAA